VNNISGGRISGKFYQLPAQALILSPRPTPHFAHKGCQSIYVNKGIVIIIIIVVVGMFAFTFSFFTTPLVPQDYKASSGGID
jgi:hypothetical protein